jgi:hypothetical protein
MNDDGVSPVEVGGMVDESSATLAVYGDVLDPVEITALLGVGPTESFARGYRRGPRSPPFKHGGWFLTVEGAAPSGPDELLKALLLRLPGETAIWERLKERYSVHIRIGIHSQEWNRGFSLSSATVARVASLGVRMEFDLYSHGSEDE